MRYKFGKTVRDDYNWNHLDEVNQVLGLKALFAPILWMFTASMPAA